MYGFKLYVMIYTETEDEYDAIMSTCDWRYGIGLVWTAFNQRDKFLDMASLHYGMVANDCPTKRGLTYI